MGKRKRKVSENFKINGNENGKETAYLHDYDWLIIDINRVVGKGLGEKNAELPTVGPWGINSELSVIILTYTYRSCIHSIYISIYIFMYVCIYLHLHLYDSSWFPIGQFDAYRNPCISWFRTSGLETWPCLTWTNSGIRIHWRQLLFTLSKWCPMFTPSHGVSLPEDSKHVLHDSHGHSPTANSYC